MSRKVILQPAGNRGGREHYLDTVATPVLYSEYRAILDPALYRHLEELHPSGAAAMWGVVPGNSSNVNKWRRISPGDIVLFSADKRIHSYGEVVLKFNSRKFAEALWGRSEENQTWEYMYTLKNIKSVEIPYAQFNKVVGYKENNVIQGFTVMDDIRSKKFLNFLSTSDSSIAKSVSISNPPQDTFGEISQFAEGSTFETREALRKAGLHSKPMDGISCISGRPADAIVLSGGYAQDIDEGDYILYTGQGGQDPKTRKQVRDQKLEKGNLALVMSKDRGIPIRVIRGSGHKSKFSPSKGYRYDGLYLIEDAFTEQSVDGPWIWRFELRKIKVEDSIPWSAKQKNGELSSSPASKELVTPEGNESPERRLLGVVQRIVRNSRVTQFVKALYDNRCQFCEVQLMTSSGGYSEGAHIRPLGGLHKGSDTVSNVLCLCSNCHTLFDKGALYVDEVTLRVKSTIYPEFEKNLTTISTHQIDSTNLKYHRIHIAGFHTNEPNDPKFV